MARENSTNTAGILGFLFSMLAACFFWIPYLGGILWVIGAILSCVGLSGKNNLYAWVGFVVSFSWILLYFLFGIIFGTFASFTLYPLIWW